MKKRNKFLALFFATALAMSVTACGGKTTSNETAGNAEVEADANADTEESTEPEQPEVDPFEAAKENMKGVTNLEATMVMNMDMDMTANDESQSMTSETTMDMTTFTDPMRMKVDMAVDVSAGGQDVTQNMYIYADTAEDGTCTMYMFDGTSWQTQTVSSTELAQYNAGEDMATYLDDSYNFEAVGTEQVDGANAYKYSGKITGDDMKQAILSSGALDQFAQLGIDSSQFDSMADSLGEIPIDLWIDEATLYPVKYEMDMTAVMDNLMANMIEALGEQAQGMSISIPKMTISMTCHNFNAATEFEIPAEATGN